MKWLCVLLLVVVGCNCDHMPPQKPTTNNNSTGPEPCIMPSGRIGIEVAPGIGIDLSTGEVGPSIGI